MINVAEMLLYAVKKCPDKIAVIDPTSALTYHQLYVLAKKLSNRIRSYCNDSKKPIIVITERSVWSIVAFWGVILSGNFYVSVDGNTPLERLRQYADLIDPLIMLNVTSKKISIGIENIDICKEVTFESMALEYEKTIIDADPLYMVFTSGSTGSPKVVIKNHRSVIAFAESFSAVFKIGEDDVLGNQTSFDFDVSAKDIYLSVYSRASMCIIPSTCFLIPSKLAPFLVNYGVTTLVWSAAAVKYVARMDCFRYQAPVTLTKVFFSGEIMPVSIIKYWREYCKNVSYVNMYAPSEVTGNCLYHVVDENDDCEECIPLSDTFPNVEVIVGCKGRVVKENEPGEIYVRGAFLASGYYNNNKETRKAFVQNPFCLTHNDFIYKTGDLALKRNGKIYFIGRKDNQIKHLGHRVELEEIENAVFAILNCNEGCALYDKKTDKIILLLTQNEYQSSDIFTLLKEHIPKYMLPDRVINIDKMPYNKRGKIDRKKAFMMYMENDLYG